MKNGYVFAKEMKKFAIANAKNIKKEVCKIMCMCGGIIEVGLIAAAVGYIGKKLHKCKCECHEPHLEHHCKHCDGNVENVIHNRKSKYKIIQYILLGIMLIGFSFIGYGVYKSLNKHHHCEEHHCNHIHTEVIHK